jgi:beta-xylosidase
MTGGSGTRMAFGPARRASVRLRGAESALSSQRPRPAARLILPPLRKRAFFWRVPERGAGRVRLIFLFTLLLAACAPAATAPPASLPPETATPAEPAPTPTYAGPGYANPVYARDFPDPHVIRVGEVFYGYSTASAGRNIPVIRSTDLDNWDHIGDGLLAVPGWSQPGHTWAPGVIQAGDAFVMYYTTRHTQSRRQCISVAVSDTPEGPFIDNSDEPFICQLDLGGSIDAYPFEDHDGQLYLLWKNDGNCCGYPVGLWVQPLSADGLSLLGEPVELVQRDQAWERPLIENPALVNVDGQYFLFYSGNRWETHEYAVGYAVCQTISGPCDKPLREPIFTYTPQVMGPGGQAFFEDADGNLWMAYHAWVGPVVGYPSGQRALHLEPVFFEDGAPVIPGPTTGRQPLP